MEAEEVALAALSHAFVANMRYSSLDGKIAVDDDDDGMAASVE
jgi:hypothetical protein